MHISSKTFALAGAAMALAITPAMAGAQNTAASMPPTAPETPLLVDGAAPSETAQTGPAPQFPPRG
jgi:hypothetical protein